MWWGSNVESYHLYKRLYNEFVHEVSKTKSLSPYFLEHLNHQQASAGWEILFQSTNKKWKIHDHGDRDKRIVLSSGLADGGHCLHYWCGTPSVPSPLQTVNVAAAGLAKVLRLGSLEMKQGSTEIQLNFYGWTNLQSFFFCLFCYFCLSCSIIFRILRFIAPSTNHMWCPTLQLV